MKEIDVPRFIFKLYIRIRVFFVSNCAIRDQLAVAYLFLSFIFQHPCFCGRENDKLLIFFRTFRGMQVPSRMYTCFALRGTVECKPESKTYYVRKMAKRYCFSAQSRAIETHRSRRSGKLLIPFSWKEKGWVARKRLDGTKRYVPRVAG